jgi:hypothetical protein
MLNFRVGGNEFIEFDRKNTSNIHQIFYSPLPYFNVRTLLSFMFDQHLIPGSSITYFYVKYSFHKK